MIQFSQYLVILPKIIIKLVLALISLLKDAEYLLFASRAKRRTISLYKRPMSDISHLSIVLVIIFALISGIPGTFITAEKVTLDPFVPTKVANEAYVTTNEQRILEADSVATLSSIYSENLGQDAAKAAEDLNNKINVASGSGEYIASLPIVSMPDSASGRNKIIKYIVQGGDTLSTIAAKFNITTATVRYANNITDENSIKPGQELTILPVTGLLYTVADGDTLAGIAARYKANQEMIIAQNYLYGEDIKPGMQLLIPDGEIPEAPKPVETTNTTNDDSNTSSSGSYSNSSARYGSGNFMFPTSVGPMGYYNGYHYWAIDTPNSIGTPILAADSGRIVEAKYGYNGGYGNTILIDHGNGFQTRYAHMTSLAVIGGYVSKGQVIGYMGSTGRSTGSHLHFEIILNGSRQNPMNYF